MKTTPIAAAETPRMDGPDDGVCTTGLGIAGLSIAGFGIAVFVWLLAPSVAWFDAGELAASAAVLGVPHPTGFPLFHLGSHPLLLLPVGPLALRLHLAGTLAAVVGCGLWWTTLNGKTGKAAAWLGALLMPLLAPSVAMHVRAAEVYVWVWLHAGALAAALVHLRGPRRISAIWALGGVGVLIHAESAALAGCAALIVTAMAPRGHRFRPVALGAAFAVAAAAGLSYLLVAAGRLPAISWGDVRDLPRLWRHISAASIRQAYAHRMGTGLSAATAMLGAQLWRDLGPWLIAAIPGAALVVRRRPWAGCVTLGLIGLDAAYAIALNPMGLRDGQVGLIAEVGMALLAWYGVVTLLAEIARGFQLSRRQHTIIAAVVLGALLVLRLNQLTDRAPNATLIAATRMADELFAQVPPGAILLASSDQRASSCIWQQAAVGVRPDSLCIPLVFTRDPTMAAWLTEVGAGRHFLTAAALLRSAKTPKLRAAALGSWLRPAAKRGPVLWERGHSFEDAQVGDHLVPGYPWDRLMPRQANPAADSRLTAALRIATDSCQGATGRPCDGVGPASHAFGAWATVWGAWLLHRGRRDAAAPYLAAGVAWAPRSAPALNNLAVLSMSSGAAPAALALCLRAIAAQPDYHRAHRTAARAAIRAGRRQQALRHVDAWLNHSTKGRQRRWLVGLVAEARRAGDEQLVTALTEKISDLNKTDASVEATTTSKESP